MIQIISRYGTLYYFGGKETIMDSSLSADGGIEQMHKDAEYWKSVLHYFEDDLALIDKLLRTPIFQPDPGEAQKAFQQALQKISGMRMDLEHFGIHVQEHENEMRGILECDDISCDDSFHGRHLETEQLFKAFSQKFQLARKEIYTYIEQRLDSF